MDPAGANVGLELGERGCGVGAVEAADRHDRLARRDLDSGCAVRADRCGDPAVARRVGLQQRHESRVRRGGVEQSAEACHRRRSLGRRGPQPPPGPEEAPPRGAPLPAAGRREAAASEAEPPARTLPAEEARRRRGRRQSACGPRASKPPAAPRSGEPRSEPSRLSAGNTPPAPRARQPRTRRPAARRRSGCAPRPRRAAPGEPRSPDRRRESALRSHGSQLGVRPRSSCAQTAVAASAPAPITPPVERAAFAPGPDRADPDERADRGAEHDQVVGVDDALRKAEDEPGDDEPGAPQHDAGAAAVGARLAASGPQQGTEEHERGGQEPGDLGAHLRSEQPGDAGRPPRAGAPCPPPPTTLPASLPVIRPKPL